MSEQNLSSVANTSISESDSSQDQQQQSIIFAPAFKIGLWTKAKWFAKGVGEPINIKIVKITFFKPRYETWELVFCLF